MSAGPIMIMAGGTGGHVFPASPSRPSSSARHREVVWLGTQRGLEARLVPQHGIEIEWIKIAGVAAAACGRGSRRRFESSARSSKRSARCGAGVRLPCSAWAGSWRGPGGIAAWLTRRPLILHEQNSVAGTTNRWLAPLATRVFEAFPAASRRERAPSSSAIPCAAR